MPKKLTKRKRQQLEADWREHNKSMLEIGVQSMVYDSFDDYVSYRYGMKKSRKEFRELRVKHERREKVRSLTDLGILPAPTFDSKEELRYTGTYLRGIATMHKSNMVPVGSEDPEDFARMRR